MMATEPGIFQSLNMFLTRFAISCAARRAARGARPPLRKTFLTFSPALYLIRCFLLVFLVTTSCCPHLGACSSGAALWAKIRRRREASLTILYIYIYIYWLFSVAWVEMSDSMHYAKIMGCLFKLTDDSLCIFGAW